MEWHYDCQNGGTLAANKSTSLEDWKSHTLQPKLFNFLAAAQRTVRTKRTLNLLTKAGVWNTELYEQIPFFEGDLFVLLVPRKQWQFFLPKFSNKCRRKQVYRDLASILHVDPTLITPNWAHCVEEVTGQHPLWRRTFVNTGFAWTIQKRTQPHLSYLHSSMNLTFISSVWYYGFYSGPMLLL